MPPDRRPDFGLIGALEAAFRQAAPWTATPNVPSAPASSRRNGSLGATAPKPPAVSKPPMASLPRKAAESPEPPRILTLRSLSGGSINQSFRIETSRGPFFCKWNPEGPRDMFARERDGLAALSEVGTDLIIPRVAALSPSGEQPVLVLEWLEPVPGAAGGRGSRAWEALGRGLAELHRPGAKRFGFPEDNFCGLSPQANGWSEEWPAFWSDRRLGPLVDRLERSGSFGPEEATVFRKLRDRLPDLLPHAPAPSLLHGDLWSGNVLLCGRGPALVDPAAYFGDREAEWAMMLLFGGFPEAVLEAYQESWPLPPGWRDRLPLYQLYHVLNHALLFGGGYGSQALRIASRYV